MTNPFLIIQLRPENESADNEFEKIKYYGGLRDEEVVRLRVEQSGFPAINLDQYSAIIVGGSPFDISTPKKDKSAVQTQIEMAFHKLFDQIVARDFPFLGCCSGNGLLGSYCGATISGRFREPVGGVDVQLTEAGRNDPLLVDLPSTFRVLVGHKEACDELPPGCVLLALGESCPIQMFRLKNNIYATQFHPEGDPEGFAVRINVYKEHGYFPPESAEQLIATVNKEETVEAQLILRRFVERFR